MLGTVTPALADEGLHSGDKVKVAQNRVQWWAAVFWCCTLKLVNLCAHSQELNMRLAKFDELDSLIRGMLYVETNNPCECYYWVNPTEEEHCEKRFFDFSDPYPFLVSGQ